jgi:hypothetical protein
LLAVVGALIAVSGTAMAAISEPTATDSPTPDPLPGVDVTCGRITFSATMAAPANWEAVVDPGGLVVGPFVSGDNALALSAGDYSFEIKQWNTPVAGEWNDVTGSKFTVYACATASPTAFESFQGATATPGGTTTPPPTATAGSSSGGGSNPLFALLICVAFGGLGLAAAEEQRRLIRR